ncbi:hypothetical protein [Nocardioides sp. SYSU DS0651]|uniref:hypothetical protein n=1 Tax=Nocardioides sp. SYSU DS0651 TaxID=3415955 RepID=UPI003F4B6DD6
MDRTQKWHARIPLTAAAAIGLTALAVPPSVGRTAAAPPTCDGKPATIVLTNANIDTYWDDRSSGWQVDGTDGDDVIVSEVSRAGSDQGGFGDIRVTGRAGDDTICSSDVAPVPGDDTDPAFYPVTFVLEGGPGSDTLVGSAGYERFDHYPDSSGGVDTLRDVGGENSVWQQRESASHAPSPVRISVPNRTITGVGTDIRWVGDFRSFLVERDSEFVGGPGPEFLYVHGPGSTADMGGGDDRLRIEADGPHEIDMGEGNDEVTVARAAAEPGVDGDPEVELGTGHDRIYFASEVTVRGGSGNDTFYPSWIPGDDGLRGDVHGGSGTNRVNLAHVGTSVKAYLDHGFAAWGDSRITMLLVGRATGTRYADVLAGDAAANQLSGNAGNDRIVGRAGDDRLAGDSGRDRAEGGPGADRCQAEIRSGC